MPKHEPHSTHSCLLLPISPHTEQYAVAQAKILESPLTSPLLWIPTSPVQPTIPSCLGYFSRLQTHSYAFTHPSPRRPQRRLFTFKLDWVTPGVYPPGIPYTSDPGILTVASRSSMAPTLLPTLHLLSCPSHVGLLSVAGTCFCQWGKKKVRNQYWRWKGKYRGSQ